MGAMEKIYKIQKSIYLLLETRGTGKSSFHLLNIFLLALISLNVLAFVLETIKPIGIRYAAYFDAFFVFSLVIFTIEYFLRVWTCTLNGSGIFRHPIRGRLRYILTPLAIVDLLSVLPLYVGILFGVDLRFLRLFRLLWIFKIARFFPALTTMSRVLTRERRNLASVLVVMIIMVFIASSLVYLLERDIQPEAFASIPNAIWWGVTTLTTVGYGDVVPLSPMGRVLGALIMLLGIATFALPAGILASAFAEESKRRDFHVSWDLVARVPFFAHLNAKQIAEIAELLHPRLVVANEVIFRKDDEADSMFFIVSGEVEVGIEPEPIILKRGDFFGEVALHFHRKRTASVVAVLTTELLELDAKDFHHAFRSKHKLREFITKEAEKRMVRTPPDILEEDSDN